MTSFHRLLELHPEYACQGERHVKLVLMGGSRNEGDARRVEELRGLAKQLGIEVYLSFPFLYQLFSVLTEGPVSRGFYRERIISPCIGLAL